MKSLANTGYAGQVERVQNVLARSLAAHGQSIIESGMLGDEPGERLRKAALFEVGCLHLCLLDAELRRHALDDASLIELGQQLGAWVLELYPGKSRDSVWVKTLAERMQGYARAAGGTGAEAQSDYFAGSLLDDQLDRMAAQLVRCLSADAAVAERSEIFLGSVEESNFDASRAWERYTLTRNLKSLLYEHTLPLLLIAASWGEDGPFYRKTVAELDVRADQAATRAGQLWEKRRREMQAILAQSQWTRWYKDGTRFQVVPRSGKPGTTRQACDAAVEKDERGLPYLRVQVDEANGLSVREILLLAYDNEIGLITTVALAMGDDAALTEPRDLLLPLGAVVGLLRYGTGENPDAALPDISHPGQLQVSRPDVWEISRVSRIVLYRIFRSLEANAGVQNPPDIKIGWVTDGAGAGGLVVAPVIEENLNIFVAWLMPPGTALLGEEEPNLARCSLFDQTGAGSDEECRDTFQGVTPEGAKQGRDPQARFVRAGQTVHGPAGEPYTVLRKIKPTETGHESEGVSGQPLLYFALPCYDLGHGLALRGDDGKIVWRLPMGEVTRLLQTGTLPTEEGESISPEEAESDDRLDFRYNPTEPSLLTLPGAARRGIASVLQRAGVAQPRVAAARTTSGKEVFLFGPLAEGASSRHWAQWCVSWYLPQESRTFALMDHPAVLPFPLP